MSGFCALLFSVLAIWDYPARYPAHRQLVRQFVVATQKGDVATMEAVCRKGVELLPDDPTWHYNLACSLARSDRHAEDAFDELEVAVDLGFRDRKTIAADTDLKRLATLPRYQETLEYVDFMKTRPLLTGPMATVDAIGKLGASLALGEQNLGWDFGIGCFVAKMKLEKGASGASAGDLYMNRDGMHSHLGRQEFPGLTWVSLDSAGTNRQMHLDIPNVLFPYPAFGNCSRAMPSFPQGPQGPYNALWRSIPRMLQTAESWQLEKMTRLYLSNQTWVFPSNEDTAPVGTNGDVFASLVPYWITTAGRSWSDLPYLRAALEASRSLPAPVKDEIVKRGLLAPTVQTLIRRSLVSVTNETDYLSGRAHPTAFPPNGVDLKRLKSAAAALTAKAVPPLAPIVVQADRIGRVGNLAELTYGSAFAWAFVLRTDEPQRTFVISAKGASEFAFVQTHGQGVDVKIERLKPDVAKVTVGLRGLSPTNRVDIMVCGRNAGTDWGAPSYVSFARMDPSAPYSDPLLTPQPEAAKQ